MRVLNGELHYRGINDPIILSRHHRYFESRNFKISLHTYVRLGKWKRNIFKLIIFEFPSVLFLAKHPGKESRRLNEEKGEREKTRDSKVQKCCVIPYISNIVQQDDESWKSSRSIDKEYRRRHSMDVIPVVVRSGCCPGNNIARVALRHAHSHLFIIAPDFESYSWVLKRSGFNRRQRTNNSLDPDKCRWKQKKQCVRKRAKKGE